MRKDNGQAYMLHPLQHELSETKSWREGREKTIQNYLSNDRDGFGDGDLDT
jgi:hypothetical protein